LPALLDSTGTPRPELLASLPALNTESWQVFPDGTMQTTYTLRPNLTWHDGQPLSPNDFVFAWRVFATRELGQTSQQPIPSISEVSAVDQLHFTIRWNQLYPDAETLSLYGRQFPPLPQHLLGATFDQLATTGPEAFLNHPYWSTQIVGLGPYRLQRWEPGAFIDAVRFDSYALGVPKIQRIELRFSLDQNVVLASLLSGHAQVAMDSSLPQVPEELIKQWGQTRAGTVINAPSSWQQLVFQMKPGYVNPRAIVDPRVRKALAHAVDRQAINDALFAGTGTISDTPISPASRWHAAVDGSIRTYPFDPRASEELMSQAGFTRGRDGFYGSAGERLALELAITESPDSVRQILITADGMRGLGFEVEQRVIPRALAQDAEVRGSFPAMQLVGIGMGEVALQSLATAEIASPASRWLGFNRGGWSSTEYDRLLKSFNTTLDYEGRVSVLRQLLHVWSEAAPTVGQFFPAQAVAFVSELIGPMAGAPESTATVWNIYEWEFR
jgi:peptide/nickel transport system substrate-binding protein